MASASTCAAAFGGLGEVRAEFVRSWPGIIQIRRRMSRCVDVGPTSINVGQIWPGVARFRTQLGKQRRNWADIGRIRPSSAWMRRMLGSIRSRLGSSRPSLARIGHVWANSAKHGLGLATLGLGSGNFDKFLTLCAQCTPNRAREGKRTKVCATLPRESGSLRLPLLPCGRKNSYVPENSPGPTWPGCRRELCHRRPFPATFAGDVQGPP